MKKHWVVSTIILVTLVFGSFTYQYAQNASEESDHAKQSLAINLLRAINTAELAYRHNHGAYTLWETLAASEEFTSRGMKWAARNDPKFANLHFANGPEILAGWNLRLNLTADGNGYDAMLQDTTDKKCGYAAITDERGVIRQSKTIDCKI